jgi:hypothetical protein
MSDRGFSIDELERDLGEPARLRVLLNAGGQTRYVPLPENAARSRLANELGAEVAIWLAARFGGEKIEIPSPRGREAEEAARRLRVAALDAGLTRPTRSANDIAREFRVTRRRVTQIRQELRDLREPTGLPLFPNLTG